MTSIVDTHCHIDLSDYDDDREAVIRSALDAGVHALIAIAFNPTRWQSCRELSSRFPHIVRSVGIHPNDAGLWDADVQAQLIAECQRDGVVAVGEVGLDFYRNRAAAESQHRAFSQQLEIARSQGLPVVIHQRAAEVELLAALDPFAPVTGVLHCFTGDAVFGRQCIDRGLLLGIGGVATFPRSSDVRDAIASLPLDRLIVETDAPFLAPQSQRGRRNAPANVVDVVETIASVRGTTVRDIAAVTTSNAVRLFGPQLASAIEHGRTAA